MSRFEPLHARRTLDERLPPLISWAARQGGVNGASGIGDEAFRARAETVACAEVAPLFVEVRARRDVAAARRDEALRQLAARRASTTPSGWLAPLRRLAGAWTQWRAGARARRASEQLAEAEALLQLEATWRSEATARLVAAYGDEAVRGRAAWLAVPGEDYD